jgi:hypothetical protein
VRDAIAPVMPKQTHTLGDVVELTCTCDLGAAGERAVVLSIVDRYMTLVFPNRDRRRLVTTGTDFAYLRPAVGDLWTVLL